MQDRHVPAIGPYYWLVFAVATVFGANMGDFLSQDLGMGTMGGRETKFTGRGFVISVP